MPYSTWQVKVGEVVNAQNSTLSQIVRKGVDSYQGGDFLTAIKYWNEALTEKNINPANKVIILENLARAYQQVGKTEKAISHWEEAISFYRQQGNKEKLGRSLTELAQLYSSLGQPKKAIAILCNPDEKTGNCGSAGALQIARDVKEADLEAAILGSLGDAYRLVEGCEEDNCKAIQELNKSIILSKENGYEDYQISALNSLSNIYINRALLNYRRAYSIEQQAGEKKDLDIQKETAKKNDKEALKNIEISIDLSRNKHNNYQAEIQGLLSAIPIYYRNGESHTAKEKWQQVKQLLEKMPQSSQKVYFAIDLANKLQPTTDEKGLKINQCISKTNFNQAENLLKQANNLAHQLQDNRAESFALGKLGRLYECSEDYPEALEITLKAREVIENNLLAKDSLFLLEWQTGRIFQKQGKVEEAIKAYKNSIYSLEQVRKDILSTNRNFQFDFRDEVEPIYRELAALQLGLYKEYASNTVNKENKYDVLGVLETMDSLKLAELTNFFGNDCILNNQNQNQNQNQNTDNKQNIFDAKLSSILENQKTAVFSSIIIENRVAIVLTLPNRVQKVRWLRESKDTIRGEIIDYRKYLQLCKSGKCTTDYLPKAENLYDWIIRPFEKKYLDKANIETLVFVQDGILQSVPMAALIDKEASRYLVEKYAIATTPSLSLIESNNQSFDRANLRVLALGLTELKYADEEFQAIKNQIPDTTKLWDKDFTSERLSQELKQRAYPIVHIATHGEFGIEEEDTYLKTGKKIEKNGTKVDVQKEEGKLIITDLDRIIRSVTKRQEPIDLLALTACVTAVGYDRSALGLAGVAVQAGAKSTLASLWYINDESTSRLVSDFYKGITKDKLSKAKALQSAQRKMIRPGKGEDTSKTHPNYWAAFVLVGNWL
jgi:CHAT domain-containing protein